MKMVQDWPMLTLYSKLGNQLQTRLALLVRQNGCLINHYDRGKEVGRVWYLENISASKIKKYHEAVST